jgi:ATP-dependent Zn protease
MAVLLAGRAAERLILGDVSVGAGMDPLSDLARATGFALLIETQCGMGLSGGAYLAEVKELVHAPSLHLAINAQLKDAEAKATETLKPRQPALLALATALDRKGYLSGAEIEAIIGAPPDSPGGAASSLPVELVRPA